VNSEAGGVTEGSCYGLIVDMISAFTSSSCKGTQESLITISHLWIEI